MSRLLRLNNGSVEQAPKGVTVGTSADIANGSKVGGKTIKDALNAIYNIVANLKPSGIKNDSSVDGATMKEALNSLNARVKALESK